jgi:predicted esterase
MSATDPHNTTPLLSAGPKPEDAAATLILIHGRGGSAEDILGLGEELIGGNVAALAPQAAGHTWYPNSFLAPLASNQPYLDSALRRLAAIVDDLLARQVPAEKIAILGFSQGACLTSEFAARNPRRYGAVIAFTGGLIGPPGTPRNYAGSLVGTSMFLGTSDPDPHVPFARVQETADVFTRMGASVDLRRYPGMPHTINREELEAARGLLEKMVAEAQ